MSFMRAMNVNYAIGDRTLLSIDELSIHKGDRIGLVGKNGQGKTMLIKYLLGELDGAYLSVLWQGSVNWMEQLNGERRSQKSGGEQTQAKIIELFASNKDVLLLDEPTNNLDLNHIDYLEQQLLSHQGAYVVISHDRALLDHTCTTIWELAEGELKVYNGNYTFYHKQKQLETAKQYEDHEKYVKEKKRLEHRIRKKQEQSQGMRKPPKRMSNSEWQLGKNKAAAKQKKVERVGKNLERRLERLETVDKPFEWEKVKMDYYQVEPLHQTTVMTSEKLTARLPNKPLYTIESLTLKTGSKTALIGDNGCGKTTLVNQILKEDTTKWVSQAKIGYFQQDLTELPVDSTIYKYVSDQSPLDESTIRIILARLHFYREDVFKSIYSLSGGERVKVALARLLAGDYNLLILDEPTNHLDIEALQSLEKLIVDYPGTVLFITHDRRFIEKVADQLWLMKNETVRMFEGTWVDWMNEQDRPAVQEEDYDQLALETKVTELISRLSMPDSLDDKGKLEKEYQETLTKLNKIRK
ncbi:ATP-binding cassette domain-containing protein [Halobacillus shinanisalinarum]|uniref:ATP-binding cassette domain-containing protein n=1 Tax=Halobacillus shinanisalinarum TaxID=2932258 RepID=A0ABY4GXN8_9BACI|nr:ABC-F family ATP-binding cassette domain-containing protein [Halobacillus shinanisalinarum]UOQ92688.1 ATP-binding cassette domain-containing protein [Halobacillus shinanisalinarum]